MKMVKLNFFDRLRIEVNAYFENREILKEKHEKEKARLKVIHFHKIVHDNEYEELYEKANRMLEDLY